MSPRFYRPLQPNVVLSLLAPLTHLADLLQSNVVLLLPALLAHLTDLLQPLLVLLLLPTLL